MITTKCTWLGKEFGCRVFRDGKLVVEGRAETRLAIGPVFRDLIRTIDKLSGDEFTTAVRSRMYEKEGNLFVHTKHIWG